MTFEDILARDGTLVYKIRGVSMKPMLRQNRDLIIVQIPSSRLKKYDVALYKRDEAYVLHRVIEVADDYYLIRGDNTYGIEIVPDEAVIGVLTGFQRDGKEYDVMDRTYRFYVHFWHIIYPIRHAYKRLCHFLVWVVRSLGVLPLLKRLLKKGG